MFRWMSSPKHWNFLTYPQVRVGVDHVSEENEDEVCVDVSLVDLVDDDVRDAAKSGLQLSKKNPDGAEHH